MIHHLILLPNIISFFYLFGSFCVYFDDDNYNLNTLIGTELKLIEIDWGSVWETSFLNLWFDDNYENCFQPLEFLRKVKWMSEFIVIAGGKNFLNLHLLNCECFENEGKDKKLWATKFIALKKAILYDFKYIIFKDPLSNYFSSVLCNCIICISIYK